jgi:thiamine kinase-like enzyme
MKDALDFLEKGKADLPLVEKYLRKLGYDVKNLSQPYRHVVATIQKSGKTYFFKMASRPSLSAYIKNEFGWLKIVEEKGWDKNWELRIPRVYKLEKMKQLAWWIGEYVDGESADNKPEIFADVLGPTAQVVKDIISRRINRKMPLDLLGNGTELELLKKLLNEKLESYEKRITEDISHLSNFLRKKWDWVQVAPARGDIGAGSFIKDKSGRVWLIDWEYAGKTRVKLYDLAYFQYRLSVNIGNYEWGEEFEKYFRQIYKFSEKDEKTLQWMKTYRLVGGYNEAEGNPEHFKKVRAWEKIVLN